MAGICSVNPVLSFRRERAHGIRCCPVAPQSGNQGENRTTDKTPQVVKLAVSGVTELLRLFSFSPYPRLDGVSYEGREEISVSGIGDVVDILKSDYENAYFVTGLFTSSIYAEDCIFEDPTIRFQGTELYSRNLKLLVPFFDLPSIGLQNMETQGDNFGRNFVQATWKLRTYLKLPWRPFISVDGSTIYELDDEFKIVRHAESWNISVLEAIGQIFTPSFRRPGD